MKKEWKYGVALGLTLLGGILSIRAQYMPFMGDAGPAIAGADAKFPQFEVTVVKPSKGSTGMTMMIGAAPDGFACENIRLLDLITNAYGIKQDQIIGGPAWMREKKFDVHAKVSDEDIHLLETLTRSQRRYMLQPLLAERFGLKVHIDTKMMPVYELAVAKGGPKMKEVPTVAPDTNNAQSDMTKRQGSTQMGSGMFIGIGLEMSALANQLSYSAHRPVLDKTGLQGKYDIALKWTPDELASAQSGDNGSDATSSPSIFTAVQEQLGLRLVSSKAPVMVLVVDHADLPTDN
jgi:uncharacterized protein (TIGR03435 family)